mgnify:FL=1
MSYFKRKIVVVVKPKMNYDKEMTKIIDTISEPKKLLLHSCCAPCSSACIERLTNFFDITILYYNPNIEPYEEYLKRKKEEIRFIKEYPNIHKLDIIDCDYDNDLFLNIATGLEEEPERGKRCLKCYNLRMEYTAKKAKELGYDYFATTLTLSPLKDSQVLNKIGYALSKKYDISYLPSDFKKQNGYKRSIELSKEYNLYRQNFCGCKYSRKTMENSQNGID